MAKQVARGRTGAVLGRCPVGDRREGSLRSGSDYDASVALEDHFDRFRVRTVIAVSRIRYVAAASAHAHGRYAWQFADQILHAPKAPARENRRFRVRHLSVSCWQATLTVSALTRPVRHCIRRRAGLSMLRAPSQRRRPPPLRASSFRMILPPDTSPAIFSIHALPESAPGPAMRRRR
jgi:hypothetical protein